MMYFARSSISRVPSSMRTFASKASSSSGAAIFLGRQALLSCALGTVASGAAVALCDNGKNGGDSDDIMKKLKAMIPSTDGNGGFNVNAIVDTIAKEVGSKVAEAVETGVPTQLSYGFVSGFCSGFALKKVGKVVGVVLGVGFMGLQTLSYSGYVDVDHDKLKKDVEGLMDLNKDGKVNSGDVGQAKDDILEILEFGLPAGCGFGTGFLFGLRQG